VRIFAGLCLLLILASSAILLWAWFHFIPDSGPDAEFLIGQDARDRLSKHVIGIHKTVPVNLLNATDDCFYFEGGSFSGTISYWMCQCRSIEDCWELAEAWSGRKQSAFEPWQPSEFTCVMLGPAFYNESRAGSLWDVSRIKNGVRDYSVYEDRQLEMFAIDFDRMRVYGAYESGGFPQEKWQVTGERGASAP
jgi:hypothetical protein